MRIGLSVTRNLAGVAAAWIVAACAYQPGFPYQRTPDAANVAGKKTLEQTYPRYCDGDTVRPGTNARTVDGAPLTNESCRTMRAQLEAYNSAPNGIPLARGTYVEADSAQGRVKLREQYSRLCVGDHLQPRVKANMARSSMAKYSATDATCKMIHGLVSDNPVETLEGQIADRKQRGGLRDEDMPIEHAQIELLKHDPQRAQPYILSMEKETLSHFGVPADMQLLGTSNLLGSELPSPGTLAPSMAILFDLRTGSSSATVRENALQLILDVKNQELTRAEGQVRALQKLARRTDTAALVEQLRVAYGRATSVWIQAALHQSTPTDAQLDPLIYNIRDLEQQLGARLPTAQSPTLAPRVAQVQSMLGPNDALVEFATVWLPAYRQDTIPAFRLKSESKDIHYVAYILTGEGVISAFDLGRVDDIASLLKDYRCEVQGPPPFAAEEVDLRARTQPLYEALWLPLAQTLAPVRKNKGHLYIAPDGSLSWLPFDALMDQQGRFLIEDWQISYLASGADLVRRAPTAVKNIGSGGDVAVFLRPQALGIRGAAAVKPVCGGGDSGLASHYQGLEGTQKEGEAIQQRFPAARVFGAQEMSAGVPSEGNLKHVSNPRVLHLATHGYYVEPTKPAPAPTPLNQRAPYSLLRSGVILEEFGSPRGGEDGILTGLEIAMLDLHATDLVVLSACDTGMRDGMPGDAVGGLRNAFRIAGAKSVVSSLWRVNDSPNDAPKLMEDFYQNLADGRTVDEALRFAKLAMLHRDGLRHPHYWASFVLDGRIDVCLRGRCSRPAAKGVN